MKMLIILLSFTALTQFAHASDNHQIQLISVETEIYPGITYTMGFDLDSTGKKVGMFYFDPTKGEKGEKHFSLADLTSKPQTLMTHQRKDKVYEVVKLSLKGDQVSILYQMDARCGGVKPDCWTERVLKVECDSSERNCVIRDTETGKTTNSLYVTNHTAFFGKVVVGVDAIESR